MPRVIISDASCFILLQKIDALDLLQTTFESVMTTPIVAAEVRFSLPSWVELRSPVSQQTVDDLRIKIDPGEASAIALALEIVEATVILDDLKARKVAKNLGLDVTGTLGVILKAKEKGIIDRVKPYILSIQQTSFRLSRQIEEETLRLAGENEE